MSKLHPPLTARSEVSPGVYYDLSEQTGATGKRFRALSIEIDVGIARVEWVQPVPVVSDAREHGHYRLCFPDVILEQQNLDVLIATTPFHGEADDSRNESEARWGVAGRKALFDGWAGFPGRRVWVTEPVIVDGIVSHVPDRTNLVWLNKAGSLHTETMSRDRMLALMTADTGDRIEQGIGLEVIQVAGGMIKTAYNASRFTTDRLNYRPFIGTDGANGKLFLMAFEDASTHDMLDYAIARGVKDGGQLDAGNTTWLIVGSGTAGVFPHSGIRGGRPIAAYLGIRFLSDP